MVTRPRVCWLIYIMTLSILSGRGRGDHERDEQGGKKQDVDSVAEVKLDNDASYTDAMHSF